MLSRIKCLKRYIMDIKMKKYKSYILTICLHHQYEKWCEVSDLIQ